MRRRRSNFLSPQTFRHSISSYIGRPTPLATTLYYHPCIIVMYVLHTYCVVTNPVLIKWVIFLSGLAHITPPQLTSRNPDTRQQARHHSGAGHGGRECARPLHGVSVAGADGCDAGPAGGGLCAGP